MRTPIAAIHDATEAGDVAEVRRILALDSAQAHAVLEDANDQPLHLAAWHNDDDIARVLLAAGADIAARGVGGWAPLHYAARHGATKAAGVLIEGGADLEVRDDFGWTPLIVALRGREDGCAAMAKVLLQHGARTDLSALVMLGDEDGVRARLQSDPHARRNAVLPDDLVTDAVIFIACKHISEGGNKARNETGIVEKYKGLVLALLEGGADINAVGVSGGPALFEALRDFHRPDMARLLLEQGADVNQRVEGQSYHSAWDVTPNKLMRALLLEWGFVPPGDAASATST